MDPNSFWGKSMGTFLCIHFWILNHVNVLSSHDYSQNKKFESLSKIFPANYFTVFSQKINVWRDMERGLQNRGCRRQNKSFRTGLLLSPLFLREAPEQIWFKKLKRLNDSIKRRKIVNDCPRIFPLNNNESGFFYHWVLVNLLHG